MSFSPGARLGPYEILAPLGAGGMGEVYRARDTRLSRDVAVKVLPGDFLEGEERKLRFEREARALAALNHPGIAAIYSFEEIPGSSPSSSRHVLVMELVEGQGLDKRLSSAPLSLEESLSFSRQIAEALSYAHGKGILHRDLKPANVMVSPEGRVKLLDFGLAKQVGLGAGESEASTLDRLTEEGSIFGTLSYMSPEQLLSKPLDQRSDLFALGIVIWEMATGKLPFEGSSKIAVANAILHAEPRALSDRLVPEKLRPIVQKLLQKDPEKRYASAAELQRDLTSLQEAAGAKKIGLSRTALLARAAAALLLVLLAGWYWRKTSRERWALAHIPEIARLVEAEEFPEAASLLSEARAILPNDAALEKLWLTATEETTVETDPPGAEVSVRPYKADENDWKKLGNTPLEKRRLSKGLYVWRLTRPGSAAVTFLDSANPGESLKLQGDKLVPPGMVAVPVHELTTLSIPGLEDLPGVRLDAYAIDRTEVTNEEYARFVDAGGYRKREYWKEAFVRDGRTIPWEEAVSSFRDATGRPGPATWDVGSFPKGLGRHPVTGVSWYEAAAYALYAGKSLPTIFHWNWAAQTYFTVLIVPGSNFGGGTQPVGEPGTLSGFGTSDMAGNVKEWCSNEAAGGKRFILGGGFGEPTYMFYGQDAQSPWDRRPNYGFRCVKLASPPPGVASAKVEVNVRDYWKETPVSDEVFAAYRGLYAYDKRELNARIEETEATEAVTREKISFDAAYGGERMTAHLFLPRNSTPPFQTVVFFPGDNAIHMDRIPPTWFVDSFFVKSGRAVLVPTYKGTFERRDALKSDNPAPTASYRDHMIAWSRDLGRSVDYLQTRKDIDSARLAYWGFSWGAEVAPVLLAVEDRFKAAVLEAGCFAGTRALPEADNVNFITRVKIPVLMLNGRYDFFCPVETLQLPFFRLLGTPREHKRHVVYDSGHIPPLRDRIREDLDWLDKYLGPVKR